MTANLEPGRLSFPDGWQGWHLPTADDPRAWRVGSGLPGEIQRRDHDYIAGAYLLERMRLLRSDPVAKPRQWLWRISHAAGHLLLMRDEVIDPRRADAWVAQWNPVIFGMGWTYAYVLPNGDPWPVDRIELYRADDGVGSPHE